MVLTRFRLSKSSSTETNQKELKSDVRRASIAPNALPAAADGDRAQGSSRPEKRSEIMHTVSSRGGGSKGRSSRSEGRRDDTNLLLPPRHESMNPGRPIRMERSSGSHDDDGDGDGDVDLPKLLRDLPNYSFTSNSDAIRMMNSCSTSTTSINSLPEAFRGATPNQSFTMSSMSHSSGASSCWEGHIANNFLKQTNRIDIDGVHMAHHHHQGDRTSDNQQQQQQQQEKEQDNALVISSICVASRINTLVSSLGSDHVEVRRNALTELRLLAKHDDDRRVAIFNAGASDALVQLLYSEDVMSQQEATTTLLNLSLNPRIKAGLIESGVIEPLVRVIRLGLTPTSTEHAAVALGNLVRKDERLKERVGELGAVSPLLELLYGGSERGKKDAAMALYILSSLDENKRRMVRGGATRILLQFLSKDSALQEGMMGKSIAILKNLVSIEEGRVAFVEEGGLKLLFGIIQGFGTRETQEFSLGILMELCRHSSKHATLFLKMDPLPSLETISNTACVRLKSKASELINILEEHKLSPMKQLNRSRHS